MSDLITLTIRLTCIGIMFLPGVHDIISYFLPFKLLAEVCTAFVCMAAAMCINDWLFSDNYVQQFLKAIASLFK